MNTPESGRPEQIAAPRRLAPDTRQLLSAQPLYGSLAVGLEVGGERYPVSPMSAPAFSGRGLSLDDLRQAVEWLQALRTVGDPPLAGRLELWPLLDPFEHPEPAAVWSLLRASEVGTDVFQASEEGRLIPTEGLRLGTDPGWREVLEELQQAGLRHVWFTLLGLETTHDTLCGRPGAFRAVVTAMERCAAVGLETGANIFVSIRNTGEVAEIARLVRQLGAERFVPTCVYFWSPLNLAHEAVRPEPEHLVGLPPDVPTVNWGFGRFWADTEAFTEAALTRAALDTASAAERVEGHEAPDERVLGLVVDANLDLLVGSAFAPPLHRVANLRDDSPEAVRSKLLGLTWPPQPPPDAELAARYGDPASRKVHPGPTSVRRKWVAAWRAEHHVPWLAQF